MYYICTLEQIKAKGYEQTSKLKISYLLYSQIILEVGAGGILNNLYFLVLERVTRFRLQAGLSVEICSVKTPQVQNPVCVLELYWSLDLQF